MEPTTRETSAPSTPGTRALERAGIPRSRRSFERGGRSAAFALALRSATATRGSATGAAGRFGGPDALASVGLPAGGSLLGSQALGGSPLGGASLSGAPLGALTTGGPTFGGPTFGGLTTERLLAGAAGSDRARAFDIMAKIKGSDQTAVAEYDSPAQARTWGYSTCSAASLTAVLRASGLNVRIADVMREMPGGMTPALGLVSRPSLVRAAGAFGAQASDDVVGYEALGRATASGQPVLVDFRNRTFPDGHWIVVTGVDANGVRVADSSRHNTTFVPKDELLRTWSGKGIRISTLPGPRQGGTA